MKMAGNLQMYGHLKNSCHNCHRHVMCVNKIHNILNSSDI